MNTNDLIKSRMKSLGYTQDAFAEMIGYKGSSSVRQRLSGNMRVDVLINFLDALGCELVIREKEGNQEWIIDEGVKSTRSKKTEG